MRRFCLLFRPTFIPMRYGVDTQVARWFFERSISRLYSTRDEMFIAIRRIISRHFYRCLIEHRTNSTIMNENLHSKRKNDHSITKIRSINQSKLPSLVLKK